MKSTLILFFSIFLLRLSVQPLQVMARPNLDLKEIPSQISYLYPQKIFQSKKSVQPLLTMAQANLNQKEMKHLKKQALIKAPLEAIWADWTTSEGITSFLAPQADVALKMGGNFHIFFMPDAEEGQKGCDDCKILSYIPQKMLSFEWKAPPHLPEARKDKNWVVIELETYDPLHTKITLTHWGWQEGEQWEAAYAYFDKAWESVLKAQQRKYQPEETEKTKPYATFLYRLELVDPELARNPDAWTEEDNRIVGVHFQKLQELQAAGSLIMAGRSPDPERGFGLVLFKAASKEEAQKIMEADPAVEKGLMSAELFDFGVALIR